MPSKTLPKDIQRTDEREIWRLVVRFGDQTANHAVARDHDLIERDLEATRSMFGADCEAHLECTTTDIHDGAAWIRFVDEMVQLLKQPMTPEGALEGLNQMNEIRERYLLSADVTDQELRELEMGVRETLRITGQLDGDKPARKSRGFGK